MLKKTIVPISMAAGMALAGSLAGVPISKAEASPFAMTALSSGYMASSHGPEGKCGGDKEGEGKCGEGKCGGDKEGEGKCGEGKCGGDKEGEGKCGGDKEKPGVA
jgi:uncharacterized low-complexity protein